MQYRRHCSRLQAGGLSRPLKESLSQSITHAQYWYTAITITITSVMFGKEANQVNHYFAFQTQLQLQIQLQQQQESSTVDHSRTILIQSHHHHYHFCNVWERSQPRQSLLCFPNTNTTTNTNTNTNTTTTRVYHSRSLTHNIDTPTSPSLL